MSVADPGFRRLAWSALAFTVLVILWGAVVRATGSGAGCGSHWPLCNGEVVPPSPNLEMAIEFSHRLTSGVSLLLVVALWWLARRRFEKTAAVRRAAFWSLFFMLTEAAIGAGLVLLEYVADDARVARGFWVGGHLVNTFLLLAAMTACAAFASGQRPPRLRGRGLPVVLLAASLAGVLLLGVSGAVTALGDTLFPAASFLEGKAATFSPSAHLFVRLRIWHPTLALAVGTLLAATAWTAARGAAGPGTRRLALALVVLYAGQLLLGLANMWFLAPLPLQIGHLLVADLLWMVLVLLALAVLAGNGPDYPPGNRFVSGDR